MSSQDVSGAHKKRETLRDRTRRAMMDEVTDVAYDLFLEQGFDQTTAEQISERAGISRSSFFRYFPTKEDVVVGNLALFGEVLRDALVKQPAEASAWEALRGAMNVVTASVALDPDRTRATVRMQESAPSLRARHFEKTLIWRDLLVPETARRAGVRSIATGDARAQSLVAASLVCLEAATAAWCHDDRGRSLDAVLDEAMSAVHFANDDSRCADNLG